MFRIGKRDEISTHHESEEQAAETVDVLHMIVSSAFMTTLLGKSSEEAVTSTHSTPNMQLTFDDAVAGR